MTGYKPTLFWSIRVRGCLVPTEWSGGVLPSNIAVQISDWRQPIIDGGYLPPETRPLLGGDLPSGIRCS